jgi:uncharacterized membrane protein YdbT with pleckstrin-like domain
MQRVPIFKTILIQPDWKQFVINELPLLLLCPVGLVYAGLDEMPFRCIVLVVTILLSLCLLYRLLYLKRMKFLVGSEQLVIEQGIFQRKVDYVELYRIVDFNVHQTLMQQIFGLKTISIYSGDRTTPKIDIIGAKAKLDYVSEIRARVITSRKNNGIYEITNR